ncbi:MAG: fumarylacetoacetate hydrolase family protein [Candidatus Bathyarchaeota archaeon]|nr:fumarylacetoacetate hydrolase family protein [Candidatus Bathyarchaeota archaeon]MDH5494235.1 fumarylacetoacetate hydrolase family protein [Candidatus Bathyarchaeota archaeon]
MKLVCFSDSTKSYGVLEEDQVICLSTLAKALEQPYPHSLEALISQSIKETSIEQLIQNATKTTLEQAVFPLSKVKILAPIATPPKIICLGLNYKNHAAEQEKAPPDEPVIFMKPHTTIIGPNENIVKPHFVKQLDYEAELAIVMGKKAKNVSANDAKSYIFGYTILNDVSARDIQFKDKQWTRGKSFDTFAPTGPCITTTNQITDPTNLRICTWVNKELRQDSNTSNMALNVLEIVHHLSRVMTLEPCDIIATGTPAGVGFAMKPKSKFLQKDDVVEIEVEGIGVLRNRVVEDKATL